jgi:transposase-like protein
MWKDVYEEFSELIKSEQMALFNAMKEDLFPDEPDKITKLLKSIREIRFASGLGCVHCGSTSVKRNGKYRSRQRYFFLTCSLKGCI